MRRRFDLDHRPPGASDALTRKYMLTSIEWDLCMVDLYDVMKKGPLAELVDWRRGETDRALVRVLSDVCRLRRRGQFRFELFLDADVREYRRSGEMPMHRLAVARERLLQQQRTRAPA